MENFWETEKPMTADTGRNIIEFFPDAGKLSISKPNWTDKEGNEKRGKTVLLDILPAIHGDAQNHIGSLRHIPPVLPHFVVNSLTSITLLIVNFRCCGYHYYGGYMDYIKGLPLAPHRCRSAPHQLPLAAAVCTKGHYFHHKCVSSSQS